MRYFDGYGQWHQHCRRHSGLCKGNIIGICNLSDNAGVWYHMVIDESA